MLPTGASNAAICFRCRFRVQRQLLQAKRWGHDWVKSDLHPHIRFNSDPAHRRNADNRRGDNHAAGFRGKAPRRTGLLRVKPRRVDFEEALRARLDGLKGELQDAPVLEQLRMERQDGDGKEGSFKKIWKAFTQKLEQASGRSVSRQVHDEEDEGQKKLVWELRDVYAKRGPSGLEERLRYAFYGHVLGSQFTASDINNQQALADLRYPSEWFPATRYMHRTVHLHVGPTNSGKTYHALQRLEKAKTGIYAGPLRLLAHEVYSRLTAKGRLCSLITGEERRVPDATDHPRELGMLSSCTVEMMSLNASIDVAVIDEIQMIGHLERGWAWTQAFMGVKAKEVHLCGEERTVPLVQELCASLGDKLEIHHYQRLNPLKMSSKGSLNGRLQNLRKGDCIVSFSVMGIHALRQQIERATGKKVAIVYGSLPPETRAQQARLFNDAENDYDFLVASDAVGMGLNLAIKRVIFETTSKFDGYSRMSLSVPDIKQIAGRAGRYRTAHQASTKSESEHNPTAEGRATATKAAIEKGDNDNTGIVTTLEKVDFRMVEAAMKTEPEPIRSAGLFPPASVLERFSTYFPPGTPFSYILTRLHELSQVHPRFHLCGLKEQTWAADLIESVKELSITDRNIICAAPAGKGDADLWRTLLPAYARCIAEQGDGNIVDFEELPLEVLEAPMSSSRDYLRNLERLHKGVVTYLWLSYRFAGIFTTRALAFHVKDLVEAKIEECLSSISFSDSTRRAIAAKRRQQTLLDLENAIMDDAGKNPESGSREEHKHEDDEDEIEAEDPRFSKLLSQKDLTLGGNNFSGEDALPIVDPAERGPLQGQRPDDKEAVNNTEKSFDESHSSYSAEQDSERDRWDPRKNHTGNVTLKHLADLDINSTEIERDLNSRP